MVGSSPSDLGSAYPCDVELHQYNSPRFLLQLPLHSASPPSSPPLVPSRNSPKKYKCFNRETGGCYLLGAIIFIFTDYIAYSSVVLRDLLSYESYRALAWAYIILFHCFMFLCLLSFIQTARTNPGSVPVNWGFYMGDEYKRHRYCRVCNIWKPDRTHHCSVCRRCVLNMDHHCPWVNNCVGFYNRKFFIQLLLYAILCLSAKIIHSSIFIIQKGASYIPFPEDEYYDLTHIREIFCFALLLFMLLLSVTLTIGLVAFTRFHLAMLCRNSTTVESLDVSMRNRRQYDIGQFRNIQQVMGPNVSLWWLPCHTKTSRPVGDGVRWNQNYSRAFESDNP